MITIYMRQHNNIVRLTELSKLEELGIDDILWIDLLRPSGAEKKTVERFMEINLQTRQQIEEIESTSKYSETENATITNASFFVPTNDGFRVEPVSFIVVDGVLVSMRNHELRTLSEASKRLQMNWRNYPTGYHLLISILEVRIDYDADLVEAIARRIATLSKDISTMEKVDREVIRRINLLQENTMLIRENIFDRQRVLSGILRSERFPRDIYPRLSLMIKDVNSLISHADFDSERLDYLQESAMGLINIEQNSIMRIFTVVTLIFMPPTLLTGIWGMNFDWLPWAHHPRGFLFSMFIIAAMVGGMFFYFRRKKWL